jgi:crotonobetainyl-CoA:carnitine CoA-transferase CaiB-like acyl-CoA transferase
MHDVGEASPGWPADPLLDATLPLARMKVVDITVALAGPCCSEMLADMGADVIKIENPSLTPDQRGGAPVVKGESGAFMIVNRNKRSLTLNLKDPRGKALGMSLMKDADVVVENVRPGTLEKMGMGYDQVRAINPEIVYAEISGFGRTSPYAKLGGYDAITQGISGLMLSIGEDGRPPIKAGIPISDIGASIFTAFGIMTAYIHRLKTGKGQLVDTALLDVPLALQVKHMLYYFINGKVAPRQSAGDVGGGAYRAFKTRDGGITVGGSSTTLWPRLCKALEVEELINDSRFDTPIKRSQNGQELVTVLAQGLILRTTNEWLERLRAEGVPCGPVNNLAQAVADPQVKARETIVTIEHPTVGPFPFVGFPVKFSRTPGKIRRPPPLLGEHTEEFLTAMGLQKTYIEELRRDGVC